VIPIDLRAFDGQFICQKDSFLCAAQGVEIEIQASRVGFQHKTGESRGAAGLGADIIGGLISGKG